MYLLHMDEHTGEVADVIDNVLYKVPFNRATEFKSEFNARVFLRHKWYHGVVAVTVVESEKGIEFDLPRAREEATALLDQAEMDTVHEYINTQLGDRIRRNFPAVPPEGRVAAIITRRKINLEEWGIVPVGFRRPQGVVPGLAMVPGMTSPQPPQVPPNVLELQGQLAESQKQIAELRQMVELMRVPPEGEPGPLQPPEPNPDYVAVIALEDFELEEGVPVKKGQKVKMAMERAIELEDKVELAEE